MTEALMDKIRVNTEIISLDEDSESIYGKIAEAYKTEPAVVNTADFWNNVEKLDMQPKRDWRKYIKYGAAALVGISLMGCLGQTVPPEETYTPEPTSTPTITAVPTTLPPTTLPPITVSPTPTGTPVPPLPKGCVIGDKSKGICYAGNLGGAPENSEEAQLLNLYKKSLFNKGPDDVFYNTEYGLTGRANKDGLLYVFRGGTPNIKKVDEKILKSLGLPKGTNEFILSLIKSYGDYNIHFFGAADKESDYGIVSLQVAGDSKCKNSALYVGVNLTTLRDCNGSEIKDLNPNEFGVFYVVKRSQVENFINCAKNGVCTPPSIQPPAFY